MAPAPAVCGLSSGLFWLVVCSMVLTPGFTVTIAGSVTGLAVVLSRPGVLSRMRGSATTGVAAVAAGWRPLHWVHPPLEGPRAGEGGAGEGTGLQS